MAREYPAWDMDDGARRAPIPPRWAHEMKALGLTAPPLLLARVEVIE